MIARLAQMAGSASEHVSRQSYYAFWAAAVFVSRILNAVTGGRFCEPLCARAGRNAYIGAFPAPFWNLTANALDLLFFLDRNHCFRAFIRYSTR